MTHPTRGSALLITMVALAVLLVIVVGAITFTGTNREAAAAKTGGDRLNACATVARQYVLSRLTLFGVPVTSLTPLNATIPDAPANADRSRVMNAHYGDSAANMTVVAVRAAAFGEATEAVRDVSNSLARSGSFGQYYKVTALCREANGREVETEFLFRYGL